ncbi:MAG: hypothetical protein IPL65_04705 [Lewinellaceae bacterium]|nr:hypothetical protein [Lewinellaceae bacterium]
MVTYPNTVVTWHPGEYQVVTWDVANTDKAPVNCQTVNIKLSINTGLDYNITLAAGVPNTGSACIQVPSNISNLARIRVEAAENIFFDISNANFRIQAPTIPAFSLCAAELSKQICLPLTYTVPVSTSAILGFDTLINLSVSGLPAGAVATFSQNPVMPGAESTLSIEFPDGTAEGSYNLVINGQAGAAAKTVTSTLTVVSNNYSSMALQQPADGAVAQPQAPILRWTGSTDANAYELQLGHQPFFCRQYPCADQLQFVGRYL